MSQITRVAPGSGTGVAIQTITGNSGGAVPPTIGGNLNLLGAGSIIVTGNPGTNTLTITDTGGGFPWNVVVINTAMAINNAYIANGAGTIQLLLPVTAVVGSMLRVTGINNATGWQVTQGAGQVIHFGVQDTTLGATGSLTSSATRDSIELVCVVANTDWQVISSIGNITFA